LGPFLGRSRGGLSTKIHVAVRGLGCPVAIILTAGQKGDVPQAAALLEGQKADFVMADTAYDADHFRDRIAKAGAIAVIPNNPSRAMTLSPLQFYGSNNCPHHLEYCS
jgi:transposase